MSTAPGEFVAYADSDVYFLPGWLEESINILKTYREAGKVTSLPIVGGDTTKISKFAYEKAKDDPSIEIQTGLIVDNTYLNAHRVSLGQTMEIYSKRLKKRRDTLLIRNGVEALLSGADFQFVITKKALKAVLPLVVKNREEYYDPIYSPVLEYRLDKAGFWQLSTKGYFVHHMGNCVPDFEKEMPWMDPATWETHTNTPLISSDKPVKENWLNRLLRIYVIRRIITKIHIHSYRWLYK